MQKPIHLDTLIGVVLNSHTATSGCGSISDTAFQTRGSTAERLQSLLIVCTGAPWLVPHASTRTVKCASGYRYTRQNPSVIYNISCSEGLQIPCSCV